MFSRNLKLNLIYILGFISAFHLPTGHPVIELVLPPLFLFILLFNLRSPKSKSEFIFLFAYIFINCFSFTIFYVSSRQAAFVSAVYPDIYTSFLYQTFRVLLLPIALIVGTYYSSLVNFKSYLLGLLSGIAVSLSFGLFSNLLSFSLRLRGLSGEPRHLGQLLAVTFLLFLASKPLINIVQSRFFRFLPIPLIFTFSFTGIMSLVAPLISFFTITRFSPFFSKFRISRLFLVRFLFCTVLIFFLFNFYEYFLALRSIPLSLFDGLGFIDFLDYALGKDTVPLRYMLNSPLSFLFGLGPSGLQIQFIKTNLSLIQFIPHLDSVGIFENYLNSDSIEGILVPSSSLLYIVSIVGILPYALVLSPLKSSFLFTCFSSLQASRYAIFMSIFVFSIFASFSNFLILIFALSLSSGSGYPSSFLDKPKA